MLSEIIPPFKTLRPIKKEKFKKLKKYLEKNLAKNFVKKSILLIKHVIFFASKKTAVIDYISIIAKQIILR